MKFNAAIKLPSREAAIALTKAWGRFSLMGHSMSATKPDGSVEVILPKVGSVEKDWIESYIAKLNSKS